MTLDEAIFYYTNTQSNSDVLGFLIDYKRLLDSDKKKDERIQELESENKLYKKAFELSCDLDDCPHRTHDQCKAYLSMYADGCHECRKDYFLKKAKGEQNEN